MARILIETGDCTPGPDPWSITRIYFTKTDGTQIKVVLHMGSQIFINNIDCELYGMDQDEQVANKFEELTGITFQQAYHIDEKLHPYFEDPMGSARDYI